MTDDLAARAVACRAWRWMPGMLARGYAPLPELGGAVALRVVGDAEAWGGPIGAPAGWLPDLSDPATLGCLLALVREAWGEPTLCPTCTAGPGIAPAWGWVLHVRVGRFAPLDVWSATEAEALVLALEAAA